MGQEQVRATLLHSNLTHHAGKSNDEAQKDFLSTPLSDIDPYSYGPFYNARIQNLETVGDVFALSEALEVLQAIHKNRCRKPKPGTPDTVIVQIQHEEQDKWSYSSTSTSGRFGRPVTMRIRKDATMLEVKEMVRKRLIRSQCWRGGLSSENNGRDDNGWSLEGGDWSKGVKVNVGDSSSTEVEDDDIVGNYWEEENDRVGTYSNNNWYSNSSYSTNTWNRNSSRSNKPKGPSVVKLKFVWTSDAKDQLLDTKWDKDMAVEEQGEEETQMKGGVTLMECIKNFTTEEQLEENEEWYCSKCKVRMEER